MRASRNIRLKEPQGLLEVGWILAMLGIIWLLYDLGHAYGHLFHCVPYEPVAKDIARMYDSDPVFAVAHTMLAFAVWALPAVFGLLAWRPWERMPAKDFDVVYGPEPFIDTPLGTLRRPPANLRRRCRRLFIVAVAMLAVAVVLQFYP